MDRTPRGHDVGRPAGRVQALPDERLLVLKGDVDLAAVETFDRSTSDDLAWVRSIDVSGVSFVDTQGLGLLLRVAAPRGRDAPTERPALLGASPQVQQLLEMLGVDALFEMRALPGGDGAAADELRPPA
ncbi:STAS domain-containing protein [uncultured Pseudokineococcus sp.]|uniref:STAS domain-containing protein n=1 Tax=uncultured Pseudokineococcus sp. TaxID=1642928 RepID=UPI0026190F08|nr:STAS domain-containing protein [uncultured Pseudokineococcus sp.]